MTAAGRECVLVLLKWDSVHVVLHCGVGPQLARHACSRGVIVGLVSLVGLLL